MDDRIRIRCDEEDRARWKGICADFAVDEPHIATLRALMDVYEHAPSAVEAVDSEYVDPDDQIVLYPEAETARRFRYFTRHYDTEAEALRALLDLWENHPGDVPTQALQ